MIIILKKASAVIIEKVYLTPGVNVITDDAEVRLKNSKSIDEYIDAGILEIKSPEKAFVTKSGGSTKNSIPKNSKEKIVLIKQCLNTASLDAFGVDETRAGVLKAINVQRELLVSHRDETKDEDESEE